MPGFNPENINIHDLTVETPEQKSELPFDVERDITEADWDGMERSLETQRVQDNNYTFCKQVMRMKILSQEKTHELDIVDPWQREKEQLKVKGKDYWLLPDAASAMKVILPERIAELNIDDAAWDAMSTKLKSFKGNQWGNFLFQTMCMKILFPDRANELNIDEVNWDGIKKEIGSLNKDEKDFWPNFSSRAMWVKTLCPEKMGELNINSETWKNLKAQLDQFRDGGDWYSFSKQAMDMKILAAEKVEITGNGLEITMPQKKSAESEDLQVPEQRKF